MASAKLDRVDYRTFPSLLNISSESDAKIHLLYIIKNENSCGKKCLKASRNYQWKGIQEDVYHQIQR